MNTDTPRTDDEESRIQCDLSSMKLDDWNAAYHEMKEHAQKLERELTAAREELAEWSILKGWGGTPEIINDFIKGQQTRIHYAQNIEEELTAVTEQRDRLAEAFRKIKKAGGTHDDSYDELDFIADVIFEALQSLTQPDNA